MKKKSILLILLTAITIILTIYVISVAAETSFTLGKTYGMIYGNFRKSIINGATNLMNQTNTNYFCANHIKELGSNKVYSLGYFAKITITKDKLEAEKSDGTKYEITAGAASRALALLFSRIKDGYTEVNKLEVKIKYDGKKPLVGDINEVIGQKTILYRRRYSNSYMKIQSEEKDDNGYYLCTNNELYTEDFEREDGNFYSKDGGETWGIPVSPPAFAYDYGQQAMWFALKGWNEELQENNSNNLLNDIIAQIQSAKVEENKEYSYESSRINAGLAYAYGGKLYESMAKHAGNYVDNEYGIENENEDKLINTKIDNEGNTILGPFQYKFSNTIENGKPTLTLDNKKISSDDYFIVIPEGSTFREINEIVSGEIFYIKISTLELEHVQKISLGFQVEGISLSSEETATTVHFFKNGTLQPIINIEQSGELYTPFEDDYILSQPVDVSLEKLDISGNPLKAEGIKFQIRDNINAVVAYLKIDANGNGIITDSKGNPTEKTEVKLLANQAYTLIESENSYYGYKKGYLKAENIEISGAEIEQSGNNIKFVIKDGSVEKLTIKAKNEKELSNLAIEKIGTNSEKIENVEFIIKIDSDKYLQLKDSNNQIVTTIKGSATINSDNIANANEYHVEYVSNMDQATKFITDSNGNVAINNLEINKSGNEKYTYTAIEKYNPNYGYGSKTNTTVYESVQLKLNETTNIGLSNIKELGNIELKKYDKDNTNVVLSNVGFAIELTDGSNGKYGYLALYNKNGELVETIKDLATINNKNKANDTEYKVSYYFTERSYKDLSGQERENITIFLTGDDGKLNVNNLEVYSSETGERYTYKLIETSNPNKGYLAEYQESGNINLTDNKTVNIEISNKIVLTEISGYVWLENLEGKANEYDSIYTDNGNDKKLTDLYILENDVLVKNPNAEIPVEIKLRNRQTGEIIKELPDKFDEAGKYIFTEVFNDNLANYEVVFEYDGFYYTTVEAKLNVDNGSKVYEVKDERTELNNKFASVEINSEVISTDGTKNTVEYVKDGHTSTLSKLNFDTTISANTSEAKFNLDLQPLNNVNMGIVLREQPKISINSDIYSALIEFEGYKYNYKYNGRQNYYENVNGDDIGVKFEQEYTTQRYTRTVYASDIQAAVDFNKEIKLSITYKIQIANQSKTLNIMPKQIINYFDSRYEIQAIGLGLDESQHVITDELTYSIPQVVEGLAEYKSTIIDFSQLIGTKSNVKDLYITFNVGREAIVDLLNKESTYHNASEILSYATYYSEETIKTEKTGVAGEVYAGIDKMSQPGNAEIKLIDHPSVEGTKIIDTTDFEDDTTSAPSLILEAKESRIISGTIWEDADVNQKDNERLGNGIFDEGQENKIQGVKVQLLEINDDGTIGNIAKYSNGEESITTSDENGNYKLGYYDETTKKYVGILPGKYVIQFTYNNEAYIVGKNNINVNDYKSTIITSDVVKNAFNNQDERWYTVNEEHRYSDARDNISLRKEYANPNSNIITNATYNNDMKIDSMDAYTPAMDIGIEFTKYNEADALILELLKEFTNIDFGIVERPKVDITIEKEITGLEIVAQNGTSIIPHGNPSDLNSKMQYVKKLDGLVVAEIEAKLLQGAQLKLEYTITVLNKSEKDYLEQEYYYYGTGGKTEIATKAVQVADFVSGALTLDLAATEGVWNLTTAQKLHEDKLICQQTRDLLINGNYNVLTTKFEDGVRAGEEKSVKLYASKYLAMTDKTKEENIVEIIELEGTRTVKDSIPGNYEPLRDEPDDDRFDLVITPPTGTKVNCVLYIIAGIVTSAILVVGIVIIKKKLIK